MQKTKTFLMFVGDKCGKAEEAIKLYTSLIPNSEVKKNERWSEGEPMTADIVRNSDQQMRWIESLCK